MNPFIAIFALLTLRVNTQSSPTTMTTTSAPSTIKQSMPASSSISLISATPPTTTTTTEKPSVLNIDPIFVSIHTLDNKTFYDVIGIPCDLYNATVDCSQYVIQFEIDSVYFTRVNHQQNENSKSIRYDLTSAICGYDDSTECDIKREFLAQQLSGNGIVEMHMAVKAIIKKIDVSTPIATLNSMKKDILLNMTERLPGGVLQYRTMEINATLDDAPSKPAVWLTLNYSLTCEKDGLLGYNCLTCTPFNDTRTCVECDLDTGKSKCCDGYVPNSKDECVDPDYVNPVCPPDVVPASCYFPWWIVIVLIIIVIILLILLIITCCLFVAIKRKESDNRELREQRNSMAVIFPANTNQPIIMEKDSPKSSDGSHKSGSHPNRDSSIPSQGPRDPSRPIVSIQDTLDLSSLSSAGDEDYHSTDVSASQPARLVLQNPPLSEEEPLSPRGEREPKDEFTEMSLTPRGRPPPYGAPANKRPVAYV